MSDQNKPKIDLKARLGRKTVGGGGPSIPPPMATGSSIPAPPFASRPPPAAISEAPRPMVVQPQAIKIEMSEEIVEAQKKGRTKVMMIAAGAAVVGMILGYVFGDGAARRTAQNNALVGAEELAKEVDAANAEIEKLGKLLGDAKRDLSDGKFPEEAVRGMGDVQIPFDGTHLVGKGTQLMSVDVNRMLIDFAGNAQSANEQKDRLQRVLGNQRKALEELFAQKEKPKFQWSVFVTNGPHGPMASMQPLPAPFFVTSKDPMKDKDGKDVPFAWPDEIEVPDGDKKLKLKRYSKGEAVSEDPQFMPVDPDSQSLVCPVDTMILLRKEVVALETLLTGDLSDPTNEKPGLVDTGKKLIDDLKSIGH